MLDEPTQGIDIGARRDLYALLTRLADTLGIGILFTSSDPEEVEALADRALVLVRGRIVGRLEGGSITASELLNLAHAQSDHRATEPTNAV
jgi:ribose transport system ATP-binding protein